MKQLKMLGFAAIAAGALMAFVGVGSASATTLTCPSGTACPAGTTIKSVSEGKAVLDAPFGNVECESTVEGHTTTTKEQEEHKETPRAGVNDGPITSLKWSNCGGDTVTTLATGSLTIESAGSNNGTLKSTGSSVTVIHLGVHCIYETSGTTLGTVTGSSTTGGNATLDIKATIPRTGGNGGAFCGTSAPWTGSYKVTSPTSLDVD
ncbi:MAG: hypothetical protein ACTHO8_04810 [Solirubrobacterales bacterium]